MDAPAAGPADRRGGPCGAAVSAGAAWHTRGQFTGASRAGLSRARRGPGSRRDEDGGSDAGHRADPVGPGPSRGHAPCDAGRLCPRPSRLRSVYAWCVVGAALLLQAPAASAYLVKSSLYWERVGAFPHYLTTPEGAQGGGAWPKSGFCYNGPSCAKNTPDYRCNPDCGNPDIGIQDSQNYPKAYMIRFVIDLVVDIRMWQDVFLAVKPELNKIAKLGTFCRDINMPLDAPDNCEAELPFFVMNITDEGDEGYVYMQHTSYWDYSKGSGADVNPTLGLDSSKVQGGRNNILHDQPGFLEVPFNLTVGYNFSTGQMTFEDPFRTQAKEYVRCPFSPKFTANVISTVTPSCYCATARCLTEDEVGGRIFDPWTATSMVTFFPDISTFRMGVTPNTQHHSPRIFAPSTLYLPILQPSMSPNISFQAIAGADEDGETVLEWETGSGSILQIAKDGTFTMPPLLVLEGRDDTWPTGWADWYNWFTWKVRVNAIDKATDPPVTTTMTFQAKLCTGTLLRFVPIFTNDVGVRISKLGDTQTIYAKDWGPSCVDSTTLKRLTDIDHTEAACEARVPRGLWKGGKNFFTKAPSLVECHMDEPCEFEVHSVLLDFKGPGLLSCKWSDQQLSFVGDKWCHQLIKGPEIGVTHDAFHVAYTGEHAHGVNEVANPGKLLIKPFQGRTRYTNPYPFDIGRKEVFCLTSTSNATNFPCPSMPHCVTVHVKGRAPVVTSPAATSTCSARTMNDASEYLKGECPDLYACWRSDTVSEITLSAEDADVGETVNIVVDSISTYTRYSEDQHNLTAIAYPRIEGSADGGKDVNDHCRARKKDPPFAQADSENPPTRFIPVTSMNFLFKGGGTPPLATVGKWENHHCGSVIRKVTFSNDYASSGLSPLETRTTPLGHRYAAIKDDSVICYTVTDNQAEVWGRGVNNIYSRCHVLRLRGAPIFQYSPDLPLDTPFGPPNQYDLGSVETTLQARISDEISFTFRARDPNPEDAISVMFLSDPGVPNEAELGPQVCVDYGDVDNYMNDGHHLIPRRYTTCADGNICPQIPSPCNEAHRTFTWTPTPGTEGTVFRVCAIAKDNNPECGTTHTRRPDECPWKETLQYKDTCVVHSTVGSSKRSTLTGFYGPEHCVSIRVSSPNPRWNAGTVPTEAGVNKLAHVGCDVVWKISVTDMNNYTMRIEVDPDTPLPKGAEMVTIQSGITTHQEFHWTPQRGMEGSFYTICWRAWSEIAYPSKLSTEIQYARVRNQDGSTELPRRCVHVKVRRCKYCVQGEDTLLVKMKEYAEDMNWLRLWAANGNDDGDELTTEVEDPGLLGTGLLDGVHNGQLLNIGPVYKFQAGDSLMNIAGRFRTTVKSLLDLNPDILDPHTVQPGQEVCLVPCAF